MSSGTHKSGDPYYKWNLMLEPLGDARVGRTTQRLRPCCHRTTPKRLFNRLAKARTLRAPSKALSLKSALGHCSSISPACSGCHSSLCSSVYCNHCNSHCVLMSLNRIRVKACSQAFERLFSTDVESTL